MASGSLPTPSRETQVSPPGPSSSLLTQLFLQLPNAAGGGGGGLSLARGQLLFLAASDASYLETKAFGGQVANGMPEFVISAMMMPYPGALLFRRASG